MKNLKEKTKKLCAIIMAYFDLPYALLQLKVTQSGTDDPEFTILNENDPNYLKGNFGEITMSRIGSGECSIDSDATPFTANKTIINSSVIKPASSGVAYAINITSIANNKIRIETWDTDSQSGADDVLTDQLIEIRVYP